MHQEYHSLDIANVSYKAPIKILIYGGTGDTGKPIAATLANNGHHVTIIGRTPKKLESIRNHGITVQVGHETNRPILHVPGEKFRANTLNDLQEHENPALYDLLIACVPSTQLEPHEFTILKRYMKPEAPLILAVNGTPGWVLSGMSEDSKEGADIEEMEDRSRGKKLLQIYDIFGIHRIIGFVFTQLVACTPDGNPSLSIVQHPTSMLTIGEVNTSNQTIYPDRCKEISALFNATTIPNIAVDAVLPKELTRKAFEKLMINGGLNPVCAIMGENIANVLKHAPLRKIVHLIMQEVAECYSFIDLESDLDQTIDEKLEQRKNSTHEPSTLRDVKQSKITERQTLIGTLRDLYSALSGKEAPYLTLVYYLLREIDRLNWIDTQMEGAIFVPPECSRIDALRQAFLKAAEAGECERLLKEWRWHACKEKEVLKQDALTIEVPNELIKSAANDSEYDLNIALYREINCLRKVAEQMGNAKFMPSEEDRIEALFQAYSNATAQKRCQEFLREWQYYIDMRQQARHGMIETGMKPAFSNSDIDSSASSITSRSASAYTDSQEGSQPYSQGIVSLSQECEDEDMQVDLPSPLLNARVISAVAASGTSSGLASLYALQSPSPVPHQAHSISSVQAPPDNEHALHP